MKEKKLDGCRKDRLILVNKEFALAESYRPKDLTIPKVPFSSKVSDERNKLQKIAAQALERLFDAAAKEGLHLVAVSGFRSYKRQEIIFNNHLKKLGPVEANKISAQAGHSEHQTGLAIDITSASVDFKLTEEFAYRPEGKWVAQNAHKYGFIIRYPRGKEGLTGYSFEPWHLRYVGKKEAKEIFDQGIILEEYLEKGLYKNI